VFGTAERRYTEALSADPWTSPIQAGGMEEETMLQASKAAATIPASDLARARAFYEGKLGLTPDPDTDERDGVMYRCADGTGFLVFESSGSSSGNHTQLSFDVDDVDTEMKELRERGVQFEDYDSPGLKTENGVAEIATGRGGWFRDSEGNLISVFQRAVVTSPASN
jgi:predicted enzyme related to lactoylglutathione lyase